MKNTFQLLPKNYLDLPECIMRIFALHWRCTLQSGKSNSYRTTDWGEEAVSATDSSMRHVVFRASALDAFNGFYQSLRCIFSSLPHQLE
jgi:hypothetical protein